MSRRTALLPRDNLDVMGLNLGVVRTCACSVSGALVTHPRLTPVLFGVALALCSRERLLCVGHLPGVSIPAAE
jgi:hypothetical protein